MWCGNVFYGPAKSPPALRPPRWCPATLARELMGEVVSPATLRAMERAESPAQGLTLLLSSAEFQRR